MYRNIVKYRFSSGKRCAGNFFPRFTWINNTRWGILQQQTLVCVNIVHVLQLYQEFRYVLDHKGGIIYLRMKRIEMILTGQRVYPPFENHDPSIINRLTLEPSRRRIDHKSKILRVFVSNIIFYQISFLKVFFILLSSYSYIKVFILSLGHFAFLLSDKILLRCHSTLKVPYESISILWWCKGR